MEDLTREEFERERCTPPKDRRHGEQGSSQPISMTNSPVIAAMPNDERKYLVEEYRRNVALVGHRITIITGHRTLQHPHDLVTI